MTLLIDYGVGNLFSLKSSLGMIGEEVQVSREPDVIHHADRLILPGVGAFEDAAKKLRASGLDQVIRQEAYSGKPLLGICLGMQLLFERSFEYGIHDGLGLLKGEIRPIADKIPVSFKIPQMGWNALSIRKESRILKNIREGEYVYFVHSYSAVGCEDSLAAVTDYGAELTACVEKNNIMGCQFHPEKSGNTGIHILKNFCEI